VDDSRARCEKQLKIDRLSIWHVLGLALVLRALLALMGFCFTHDASIFHTPDSASYIVPARELRNGTSCLWMRFHRSTSTTKISFRQLVHLCLFAIHLG
jgi:hypothetical protein